MIKFFRNIRKKLIQDGKTANYLKYAIGEIFLVVIGILIAVSINNWNEGRKGRNNKNAMLAQLWEENKVNMEVLEDDTNYRDSVAYMYKNAQKILETDSLLNVDSILKPALGKLFRSTSYTFSKNFLTSYLNNNSEDNSQITRELINLNGYQNDLELMSQKGMDLKFENFYNAISTDVDLVTLSVYSYETLKSLEFRNKLVILSLVEDEITFQFNRTLAQQHKVDSIITRTLKK